jgi:cytochrome P450 PksS
MRTQRSSISSANRTGILPSAHIHFCLGHQLARMEGICELRALFGRWPKLQLAVDESRIKWRKRPGMRAIEHLPVAVPR